MSNQEIFNQAEKLGLYSPNGNDRIGQVDGYEALDLVLTMAYQQAACGKGKERHASDLPFHEQPMQRESDDLESAVGLIFQARKKVREGIKLPDEAAQVKEVLGAINYLAGWVIWQLRHADQQVKPLVARGGRVHPNISGFGVAGEDSGRGFTFQIGEKKKKEELKSIRENLPNHQ